jgi:hypothetical protein
MISGFVWYINFQSSHRKSDLAMLGKLSPSSLGSLAFKPPKKGCKCFAVGLTGMIAVSRGAMCTIFVDTGFAFAPMCTLTPFPVPITHLAWCRGAGPSGETPLHLFISDCEGHGVVLNPVANQHISSFSLSQGSVSAVEWDPYEASRLYVGTTDHRLILADVDQPAAEIIWATNFTFQIDFIRISPFDCHHLVVASTTGLFTLLNGRSPTSDRTLSAST